MTTQDRFHALDAVRAFALLAGIVLHATMSFFIFIPAQDVSQSTTLGVAFYVIHMFRMSAVLSHRGILCAHDLSPSRAARVRQGSGQAHSRSDGWWLAHIRAAGHRRDDLGHHANLRRSNAASRRRGRLSAGVPAHAPVVPLLLVHFLCAGARATRGFSATIDRTGRGRGGPSMRSYASPCRATPRRSCSRLRSPRCSTSTRPGRYGLAFRRPIWVSRRRFPRWSASARRSCSVGYCIGKPDALGRWQAAWHVHLVIAVALTAACLSIVGIAPSLATATTVPGPAWSRLAYTACYTLAIWFWTFGIVGAGLRFCSAESPVRRYLADSSYWLYLAHLPLVFFLASRVRQGAVALDGQVPADPRNCVDRAARELPLLGAADVHRRVVERPQVPAPRKATEYAQPDADSGTRQAARPGRHARCGAFERHQALWHHRRRRRADPRRKARRPRGTWS